MNKDILTHLVVDLETLGFRENTVILSMAMVPFQFEVVKPYEWYIENGIIVKFNVEEQIKKYKRTTCKEVVDWWKSQPMESKKLNLTPQKTDFKVIEGCQTITKFVNNSGYDQKKSYIWCRRSHFDFPKISHLYEVSAGMKVPYNDWSIRDVVTLIDVMTGTDRGQYTPRGGFPKSFRKHYCLDDAAMDAYRMVEIYNIALTE